VAARGHLVKIALGIAVSAALLVYLFWDVDLRDVAAHLANTSWRFLAASVLLNLLSLWVRAWRWYYLFPPGAHPSRLFSALMIGYMGNNLLPLRAGEIVRVYVAARRGQRFWTTLATVVVERALDGLALGLIVAALFFVVQIPPSLRWPATVFLSADLAAMILLAVLAYAPASCAAVIRALFHRWPWVEGRLMDVLGTMSEGLRGVRTGRHQLPIALSSAGIWLLFAGSIWTALHAAHLDLPMAASWTVLAFLGLGVSLPSSPGFVGVVQAAGVLALALFDIPRTEALSFSLLLHASQFFPVTFVGLGFLLVEHVSLSEAARGSGAPAASPGP
jgi:glycosyltransferase 2 family protein